MRLNLSQIEHELEVDSDSLVHFANTKSSKLAKHISAGNFRTNGINIRYNRDKSFRNKQITRTNL